MSTFEVKVDPETFLTEIFIETQEEPLISQPTQPNGEQWETADQAQAWADEIVAGLQVPEPTEPAAPVEDPAPAE